jgi:hypothetical protein
VYSKKNNDDETKPAKLIASEEVELCADTVVPRQLSEIQGIPGRKDLNLTDTGGHFIR